VISSRAFSRPSSFGLLYSSTFSPRSRLVGAIVFAGPMSPRRAVSQTVPCTATGRQSLAKGAGSPCWLCWQQTSPSAAASRRIWRGADGRRSLLERLHGLGARLLPARRRGQERTRAPASPSSNPATAAQPVELASRATARPRSLRTAAAPPRLSTPTPDRRARQRPRSACDPPGAPRTGPGSRSESAHWGALAGSARSA